MTAEATTETRPQVPGSTAVPPAVPLTMPCPGCGQPCEWEWDWNPEGGGTAYRAIACPCGGQP